MTGSRAVLVTVVVAVVLTLAAFGGVYYLRTKQSEETARTQPPAGPAPALGTCHVAPCTLLASASIGTTKIELWADDGGRSARVKIDDLLLESAVASRGAKLSASSLQCVPGSRSVCLVHGPIPGGEFGEVIVGRSGKWDATDKLYFSDAGYLALADVDGDNTADVVTAQQGFFAQVFAVNGTELGCTKTVAKLAQLPGWPTIKPTKAQLHEPC